MLNLSIPLQGMSQAASRVDTAASRIARAGSLSQSQQPDTIDLSAEMIALMQSRNDFAANAKVAGSFDEMTKSVLNILA